jgi:hypothetical protein
MRLPNTSGPWVPLLVALALCFGCASSSDDHQDDACTPDDADGIISEPARLIVTVTDSDLKPKILTVQNSSDITLTLENNGTSPLGLAVDCLATPNHDGCPTESCFPADAKLEPIEPGESATITFVSPLVEGIYAFHSGLPDDTERASGQFIVQ